MERRGRGVFHELRHRASLSRDSRRSLSADVWPGPEPLCVRADAAASDHFHWAGGDWTKARGGESNDALGGGHAHSGALFLLGDQWPAEMRGDIITCNIHGNRINRDHIAKTSTGYVGQHRPDLIKFNDAWFRGVGFAAAPDGSIYVADWCDVGECHDYKEVHRNSGRIYKFWNGKLKQWKPEDLEAAKKERRR